MWLAIGAFTAMLFAIDWEIQFGDGDWFEHLWPIYITSFIFPMLLLPMYILDGDNRAETFKVIGKFIKPAFEYIGQWFKDNINWKW